MFDFVSIAQQLEMSILPTLPTLPTLTQLKTGNIRLKLRSIIR
ncbi:hypothetical protein CWATWH0402_2289 [Crocosphaera watsonii WH 0402]|uniref:Uncharacterized protein n=3 Tax=Crocosphaera watsonii TaxID=263511 RepID=T2JR14_CROWT|nr:hypothetical protein CWATWH0402_2289 [Crocosphaera watsonii WH 0402]